jgi:hypothetical protein
MPRTKNTVKKTRNYSTNVKEKIEKGEHWRLQLDIDDDNAMGLYNWKEQNINGGDYRKIINNFIREGLKKNKRPKK